MMCQRRRMLKETTHPAYCPATMVCPPLRQRHTVSGFIVHLLMVDMDRPMEPVTGTMVTATIVMLIALRFMDMAMDNTTHITPAIIMERRDEDKDGIR